MVAKEPFCRKDTPWLPNLFKNVNHGDFASYLLERDRYSTKSVFWEGTVCAFLVRLGGNITDTTRRNGN